MVILARNRRRLGAVVLAGFLAGLIAACDPSLSPAPSSSAGVPASPAASAPSVASPAACASVAAPGTGGPDHAQPSWAGRTWYEVFVRSFADADGDGVGDLAGLTAKLDYLNDGDPATTNDLGVGGIWLMPVAESSAITATT